MPDPTVIGIAITRTLYRSPRETSTIYVSGAESSKMSAISGAGIFTRRSGIADRSERSRRDVAYLISLASALRAILTACYFAGLKSRPDRFGREPGDVTSA